MTYRTLLLAVLMLSITGCALWQREPLRVSVAGIEPIQGQGLEARFEVRLRIQNPNNRALRYDGISLDLDVNGKSLASGVSDQSGKVPRYGEIVLAIPVTVSPLAIVRQAIGLASGEHGGRVEYEVRGRLGGAVFQTLGTLPLPAELTVPAR